MRYKVNQPSVPACYLLFSGTLLCVVLTTIHCRTLPHLRADIPVAATPNTLVHLDESANTLGAPFGSTPSLVTPCRALHRSTNDAVLNSQWDLLLKLRQDNIKCEDKLLPVDLSGWPTTRPTSPKGWPGVTVKDNRIVDIDFSGRSLCFPFPAYFSALTSLTSLSFNQQGGFSSFFGTLPPSWGSLTNLKSLNLGSNLIKGDIPASWTNLTALTALDLSSTGLDIGQPRAQLWKGLSRLKYLQLSGNGMKQGVALPRTWTQLQALSHLDVSGLNSYVVVDADFDAPPAPWPVYFSSMTNLKFLNLNSHDLAGKPPPSWSTLIKLQTLNIVVGYDTYSGQRGINGTDLPAAWSMLTALKHMDLPDIQWPGKSANRTGQTLLPQSWSALTSMRSLSIPCSSLLSQPAKNGIPIAPYLTALSSHCAGEGCSVSSAQQVRQLHVLSRMTNLRDLHLDPQAVEFYEVPECYPPAGAYSLPVAWSKLTKLTSLTIASSYQDSERDSQLYDIRFHPILPPAWSSLVNIKAINIDCKGWALRFGGSLPASWSTLTALSSLVAAGGYYAVPSNTAYPGKAGGLPAAWSTLTQLKVFNLDNYGLLDVKLPAAWSTMKKLRTFRVQGNCVGGRLPASWSALRQLSVLSVPTFPQGSGLDIMCKGQLHGFSGPLPDAWSKLVHLDALLLSDHTLSGTIPPSYSALKSLTAISLSRNNLKGPLPSGLSKLTNLSTLEAAGNLKLTGTLPSSWSTLVNLLSLDLSSNAITGQPPDSWGSLSALVLLDVSSNRLKGTIPPTWSAMLLNTPRPARDSYGLCFEDYCEVYLKMSRNNLTGGLPAAWGNLPLNPEATIDLSYNRLSGPLAAAPWSVTTLDLSHNSLSGSLPSAWSKIMMLDHWSKDGTSTVFLTLDLSHNKLGGKLPSSWGTTGPTAEISLHLSHNQLTGTIPASYARMLNFTVDLSSNKLTGPVVTPAWCRPGPELTWSQHTWDLSNNLLSGTLPAKACHYNIQPSIDACFLNFSHNQLSGSLPLGWFNIQRPNTNLGFVPITVDLSHNRLTGAVPDKWSVVADLNLSHNKLNGTLPKVWAAAWKGEDMSFTAIADILKIDLSHNQLQGPLPLTVYAIHYLDVSYNKLNGTVPPSKQWNSSGVWDSMTHVDLSHNSFSGTAPAKPKAAKYFNVQGAGFN